MKAVTYQQYGSPNVVQFVDSEKPAPAENQLLIKVRAASINSYDWRHVRAAPFLVRTSNGWSKPRDQRLGADFSGIVEAVGSQVISFKPGDEVYGCVSAGAYAEYLCAPEKIMALKPANVSFDQAAAAPMAALTALQGLRDKGKVAARQKVLVNGASGGVGTFAVMIAKYYGAEVTGVCSTRNLEMVRSIGADQVIDYTKEDFTRSEKQYDLIFDVAANHSVFAYKRVLASKGKYVMAGFSTLPHLIHIVLLGPRVANAGQEIGMMGTAAVRSSDLAFIGELLAAHKIVPVIDQTYPLRETAKALWHYEKEHARGKIVITVP